MRPGSRQTHRSAGALARGAALLPLAVAWACGGPEGSGGAPDVSRERAVREAVRITAAAQLAVMSEVRPGMREGEVKAIVDRVFREQGASGAAFPHIAAAGAHAADVHYFGDDGVLADGDLLLVDIGAVKEGWAADLTRTLPVSGAFTARQLELYRLALEAQELAAGRARTGVDSLRDMDGWVRAFYRESPRRALAGDGSPQPMDSFFPHLLGHYVGRTVHGEDTGWDLRLPLEPGQALTIEPGLYVPAEALGLRIEDDYWVGPAGLECLSCTLVPRAAQDVEAFMAAARTTPAVAPWAQR